MALRRLALATAAIATLLVPAGASAAEGYTITFPAGWPQETHGDIVSATMPDSPAITGPVSCNSQLNRMASMDGISQADLNVYASGAWTVADWANLLGVEAAKLEMVETAVKPYGGLYFRTGLVRLLPGAFPEQQVEVDALIGFYLLPGRIVLAGCYAVPEDLAASRPIFEATVNSLRPQ